MCKRDLLVEIGTEEIPARFVRQAIEQLAQNVTEWLTVARIPYEKAVAYGTPRRMAVLVYGVDERQRDLNEEVRGPAKRIAVNESGEWTKAAIGFARGQGVSPDELIFQEYKGEAYVFARKKQAGKKTFTLLGESLGDVITALSFPKNMRWGKYDVHFVRPIRWLVTLYGSEVVPLELAGVRASNVTRGHRFLGEETPIEHATDYEETLRRQYVIVDQHKRKELIREQLRQLGEANGWHIQIEDDLLEEVTFLVEYPTALAGLFDPQFLGLPSEVLMTSMREHQRYFPVKGEDGRLLPHFVTVRNGDDAALDTVAKGNEKVLRARLSDARFFYEEDLRRPLSFFNQKLEHVVFHEQLGTIADKVRRIRAISERIANTLALSDEQKLQVVQTAELCKFDLETEMVYEFPELQGRMGEKYALKAGIRPDVAKGISEHYLPRFSGDDLPETTTGMIVGLADKMDTVAACFGVGIVPTGSEDPYALRRQAMGIAQLLLAKDVSLTLEQLCTFALDELERAGCMFRSRCGVEAELLNFFRLRLKHILEERDIRYDIAEAVLKSGVSSPRLVLAKAEALTKRVHQDTFKRTVEAFTRVANLAKQAKGEFLYDARLSFEPAEKRLAEVYREAAGAYEAALQEGSAEEMYAAIAGIEGSIHTFFEDVMVMVDDEAIRHNRLALLVNISELIRRFADFNEIVTA